MKRKEKVQASCCPSKTAHCKGLCKNCYSRSNRWERQQLPKNLAEDDLSTLSYESNKYFRGRRDKMKSVLELEQMINKQEKAIEIGEEVLKRKNTRLSELKEALLSKI